MAEPPPMPGSTPMFFCGEAGCDVELRGPGVSEAVERRIRERRDRKGAPLTLEEATEVTERAIEEEEDAARRRHLMKEERDG